MCRFVSAVKLIVTVFLHYENGDDSLKLDVYVTKQQSCEQDLISLVATVLLSF